VDVDVQEPATDGVPTPYYAGLNPAMPASFGAVQHAMESTKGVPGLSGNGIGYGLGGMAPGVGMNWPFEDVCPSSLDLFDLQNGIDQQNLEGSAPDHLDAAAEPSSLAVFCGLGVLALWGAWLRNGKRKPI